MRLGWLFGLGVVGLVGRNVVWGLVGRSWFCQWELLPRQGCCVIVFVGGGCLL